MRFFIISLAFLIGPCCFGAPGAVSTRSVWMTGEPLVRGDVLLFHSDTSVPGNAKGSTVLLGVPKESANVIPVFMRAAEKHLKLRLYGGLLPFTGSLPGHHGDLPRFQFIVTKIHLPSDPDDLPAGTAIMIHPQDVVRFNPH